MPRLIVMSGGAAVLFFAGLLAGQRISGPRVPTAEQVSEAQVYPQAANPSDRLDDDAVTDPAATDSEHSDTAKLHPVAFETPEPATNPVESSADSTSAEVTSGNERQIGRILEIVNRLFPDADAETARIWAEEYANLPAEEAEFLLEQKRMLLGSQLLTLDAIDETTMNPPADTAVASGKSPALAQATAEVRANLQSAWSVGYRRLVVLPDSIPASNVPDSRSTSIDFLKFRSFEPGRCVASRVPTHVALCSDPALMFALEEDRLTRRGDFRVLSDGRIGFVLQGRCWSILNSPVISDPSAAVRISASGQIEMKSTEQTWTTVGHLPITRITEPQTLITEDGVLFTSSADFSASQLVSGQTSDNHASGDRSLVMPGMLELSNTDFDDEARLLEQLSAMHPQ